MTVMLTPRASEGLARYAGQQPKRHKFGAKRCEVHEGRHASLKECRTFMELQLLERAGEIRNLHEQVAIELAPSVVLFGRRKPALRIVIDFVYERRLTEAIVDGRLVTLVVPRWQTVYHDAKGMEMSSWRMKAHLLALKVAPDGGVVEKS